MNKWPCMSAIGNLKMANAEKVLVTENRQNNKMYMQTVWILFIMQMHNVHNMSLYKLIYSIRTIYYVTTFQRCLLKRKKNLKVIVVSNYRYFWCQLIAFHDNLHLSHSLVHIHFRALYTGRKIKKWNSSSSIKFSHHFNLRSIFHYRLVRT